MMKIEIIGSGCPRCYETERRVKNALAETGAQVELVHLTDPGEIARRGLILTPAVMVDGVIRLAGRVPCVDEVKLWLQGR
jgi:small redox-active disulfide protein 2